MQSGSATGEETLHCLCSSFKVRGEGRSTLPGGSASGYGDPLIMVEETEKIQLYLGTITGTIIVNTSRDGVIDEIALLEAIEDGRVTVVGLDVLEYLDEEYAKSVLMKYPDQVFVTPHMGCYFEEVIADLKRKTALYVYEMFTNGKPLYQV